MVLISPHAMQATRASTTVSVFADCSVPAGLRIGPVPGIFKLGKYVSDRKEVGPKKKVSLEHFKKLYLQVKCLNFLIKKKKKEKKNAFGVQHKNASYFETFAG